ncbi:MAG TPA: isoprenylcysteine carboxylmethyltransferase family protein [Terriglobales bacterium]|jgi:protein-S-isoprenylcysteine O-methyltransferase Ste14|nr:isoprenylcysteine carboxylmethyltransferase family protein [Terriglobales bacterium]
MSEEAIWHILVVLPWGVFVTYWIAGSTKTRANAQKEPFLSRFVILLMEFAGYLLVFAPINFGMLRMHVIPRTIPTAILGVACTWAGIGLAIWARYHLAEYWSARITIKEGHQLIRTGPYQRLRHPIYTGLILATVGSALVIDHWRCVLGVLLITVGYCFKAKREENMLGQQFGEAFQEHRKHTGFLFPKYL